ncbi:MAG: ribosome silencing factor [Acidobacteria bacterium]|nr:ribosome silencing factor [Acidobacteriota bacterium]MDP7338063.1 ribosome silencing factor [Vicinamibacterales bacterium]MDP7480276.1 ribosome silencing factor [Vicinamibacterales bacterium]HJN43546.1 ribosome silencing factor [Vicinamibacterales bacterium]
MTENQTVPRNSETTVPGPIGQVLDAAREKKTENLIVLDLRLSDAFTDYFVICSGRSTRQVKAIVDGIEQRLKAIGRRPAHIEGYAGGEWVLIDCFDFIVHVFTPETRDFYALERLWGNAVRVEV